MFSSPVVSFLRFLAVVIGLSALGAHAASIEGKWLGAAGALNNRSVFGLEVKHDTQGALVAFVTLDQLNYYGVRLPEFVDAGGGKFRVPAFGMELTLAGDRLAGTMADGRIPVEMQRTGVMPADPVVPNNLSQGPGPRWQIKLASPIYATAAVRDGIAYVGTAGGVFHAVRIADGSLAWTFSAGRPILGEALATTTAVYFVCDNGYLFKLARDTGKELWRYDLGDAQVPRVLPHPDVYDYDYQAPRPTLADGALYVGSGDGSFHAVSDADGKRLWRIQSKGKIRTDAAVQGTIVVFSTEGGLICAVDRATGRELWHTASQAPVTSSPVIVDDRVVIGGRDSQLQALDLATGKQLWKLGFWGSWVESTATVAEDRFYLGSSDLRRVGCYDPKNGRIVWRTDVFGWAWGRPLVAGKYVYIATSGVRPYPIRHLAAFGVLDRTSGDFVWRWPLAEPAGEFQWGFAASPVLSGDSVVIGALNGTLYAFPVQP